MVPVFSLYFWNKDIIYACQFLLLKWNITNFNFGVTIDVCKWNARKESEKNYFPI